MNTMRVSMPARPRSARARARTATSLSRRGSESGVLLIECLVYLSCFCAVLGAALAVFYQALDFSSDLRRNADDVVRVLKTGERWRADIRAATNEITLADGPGGHVLHIPQPGGTVVYRFITNAVLRCAGEPGRCETVLPAAKECRFAREPRKQVTAWRWDVELPSRLKAARVCPLFTFTAVPRQETQR